MSHYSLNMIAAKAYAAYCKQAGGETFDHKKLPTWDELGGNRQACWLAAAQEIIAIHSTVH